MSDPRKSHHGALWLAMTLVAIVVVWVAVMIPIIAKQPRFFRSPAKVLLSDVDWYDSVFNPAVSVPIPDLLSHPVPGLNVGPAPPASGTQEELRIEFENRYPQFPSPNQFYEIFGTDASGVVALPDGNRLRLTAVALFLPSDAEWMIDEDPPNLVPEWLDPSTGNSLPASSEDPVWKEPRSVPPMRPRLHFRVEVEGTAPIRWRIPNIHDARTKRSIAGVSTVASDRKEGFFSMDLEIWHQTPLDIGVEFAFGDPERKTLPMEKGAEVRFGDHAIVRVMDDFPDGYRFLRYPPNGFKFGGNFNFYSRPSQTPRRALALFVWPPNSTQQIEYLPDPAEDSRKYYGSRGIVGMKLPAAAQEATEMPVLRYPRLGRAVFHLPKIPRLPEVSNLFESPITKIRVKYPGNYPGYALDAAEVKRDFRLKSSELLPSEFPKFVTDTTPMEIIAGIEQVSGKRLYYDKTAGVVTDRKPPGLLEQLKDWWRSHRPRWLL